MSILTHTIVRFTKNIHAIYERILDPFWGKINRDFQIIYSSFSQPITKNK
jgi:hypothetical protein